METYKTTEKTRTAKTVFVTGCNLFTSEEVVAFAFGEAGETVGHFPTSDPRNVGGFGSSFGFDIMRTNNNAIVVIKTD